MSKIMIVNLNARETRVSTLDVDGSILQTKVMPHEDAMDIARWHVLQFGPKSVIKDALKEAA